VPRDLLDSSKALLEMDADGVLVPHGLGGHGRACLSWCVEEIERLKDMQGRSGEDTLVMVALYTYSPQHGCSVYWTGAGWHPNGREAALYPSEDIAIRLASGLPLPDGADGWKTSHRNMI